MSHVEQSLSVACPLAQANVRLGHYFRSVGNRDGDTLKFTLIVGIDIPGFAKSVNLSRSVIATVQRKQLPGDMAPRYRVQWAAEVPGPFPLFSGELLVEGEEDYDSFSLRLTGGYTPPLGMLGGGFDAVLGKRLAAATAEDLLRRIREVIEHDFRADEARKRVIV